MQKVVGEDNLLSSNFISFTIFVIFEFAKAYAHFLLSMQKSKHKSNKKCGFSIFSSS